METTALDEVEAWVDREIAKHGEGPGRHTIGVNEAKQIAVVAAHKAFDLAIKVVPEIRKRAALDIQNRRVELGGVVMGMLACGMIGTNASTDWVRERAPELALQMVDRLIDLVTERMDDGRD